jgi:hypothetical protein
MMIVSCSKRASIFKTFIIASLINLQFSICPFCESSEIASLSSFDCTQDAILATPALARRCKCDGKEVNDEKGIAQHKDKIAPGFTSS